MAITEAMSRGTLQQRKALLQRLVVGVEVNSRDEIIPTFRIPATPVRVMDRMVGRGGLEPPTSAVDTPQRCGAELRRVSVRGRVMVSAGEQLSKELSALARTDDPAGRSPVLPQARRWDLTRLFCGWLHLRAGHGVDR